MELAIEPIKEECKRQEESCLYTSTALFEWLKELRCWKIVLVVAPIVFSAIAASALIKHCPWVTGTAVLLAGILPAIFKALNLDKDLVAITLYANGFKILQDRFRQCWRISSLGDADAFRKEFQNLMSKLDDARKASIPPPERYFKKAKAKIDKGHYSFAADQS